MLMALKSRKFWGTVLAAAWVAAGTYLKLDPGTVKTVATIIMTYVVGQAIADAGANGGSQGTKIIILLMLMLFSAYPAKAQSGGVTGFEFGADTYNASKYPNGYITIVGVQSGNTGWPYVTADFHPTGQLGRFTYDIRAGVEQTLAESTGGYKLLVLGQAGIAQSAANAGGIFSGGLGLIIPTASKLHGFNLVITGEGMGGTVSDPTLALRIGFRHGF